MGWSNTGGWRDDGWARPSAGGGGGFTLVAHTIGDTSVSLGASPIITPSIDTSGATLIVLAIAQYGGYADSTASDSKSNTWTALAIHNQGNPYSRLFYCTSPTVGSGHTFTLTNSGGFIAGSMGVQAWSGGTGTFDVQNGTTTGFGTSLQPGSVTPSVNNSLIITAISVDNTATAPTIGSGFIISDSDTTGTLFAVASFVQSTAAAINPTWSWTSGGSDFAASIATFKP